MMLNTVNTSDSKSTGPWEGTYRRAAPPRGRKDALDSKVVAVGEGPAGGAR